MNTSGIPTTEKPELLFSSGGNSALVTLFESPASDKLMYSSRNKYCRGNKKNHKLKLVLSLKIARKKSLPFQKLYHHQTRPSLHTGFQSYLKSITARLV